jgi:sigma-B regulation protein RsbU (phosphoserine phosphatase)
MRSGFDASGKSRPADKSPQFNHLQATLVWHISCTKAGMPALRALIADDQRDITEALRLLLKREGYQTESVNSPEAVLKELSAGEFDLLLMDLNYTRDTTSGAEGLDLLGRIRAFDSSLPVVVMTAWGSIPLAVEAMRRGARDFVEKPWDNAQLLKTLRQQLGARQRSAREEMRDAVAAQNALLPKIPQIAGCELAMAWKPAREVSGDYLDLIPLGGNCLGIAVGDVAGKGVAAALVMSNLQAGVRAMAPEESAPERLLQRMNRTTCRNVPVNRFITLFYGILEGRRLRYSNAGHPAPLLVRHDGTVCRLETSGAVLGVLPDWAYEPAEVELRSGDRLVLFSDGIVEAENAAGAEFGEERLLEAVRTHRSESATNLKDRLMEAVNKFAPSLQDDTTLLVVAIE